MHHGREKKEKKRAIVEFTGGGEDSTPARKRGKFEKKKRKDLANTPTAPSSGKGKTALPLILLTKKGDKDSQIRRKKKERGKRAGIKGPWRKVSAIGGGGLDHPHNA